MIANKWMLLGVFFFLSVSAKSIEPADSINQFLEKSVLKSPVVLQKLHEYKAALQKIPQAGSLSDPELNVGVFLNPMELVSGNQVADIQLMQMFPWFGVLKNAKDEMSLMAKSKYESFRTAQVQMLYDLQRTWYEMQKNREVIHILEENRDILKTIERIALVKFRAGSIGTSSTSSVANSDVQPNKVANSGSSGMQVMGSSSFDRAPVKSASSMSVSTMASGSATSGLPDLYRVQIELGDLENSIALQKGVQKNLIAQFNSYLNNPLAASLPTLAPPEPLKIENSPSEWSDSLIVGNPMLEMIVFEQRALDARSKMVTSMSYPMVGVGVDYSLIKSNPMSSSPMNGKDMVMPMIKLTLPIYRRKYKSMKSEVDEMRLANEQGYFAALKGLQMEYQQALLAYIDASRRMDLYENQRSMAKKTLDITIKTFSASGSNLTDVLQLTQGLLNYEQKKVEAITDFNTSIAWLNKIRATAHIQ